MEIKMLNKSYGFMMLFILIFTGYTFTDQIPNVENTDKAKAINTKEIVTMENAKILYNSSVILDSDGSFSNYDKVTGLTYDINMRALPLDPKELVSKPFDDKKVISFKLVEVPGKKNMLSDGGFIVEFKNISDAEQFNLDYNLVPKYQTSNANIYKTNNFKTLPALMDLLKNDERVQLVELDLIDPYIVLQ
jgi:hypothetical protein